jgi:hypothetical protein
MSPSGRRQRAVQGVRRVWPYVLMAWERWQALPPVERERYKRRAREYAERGRGALERARPRRGGRRRG